MNNIFRMATYRFHTKQKNKLLIIGVFEENLIGKNKITLEIDGRTVPYEMEEKERTSFDIKSKSGNFITKDYYFWAELPGNWREAKELLITNSLGQEKENETIPISKLIRMEKKVHKYVDKGEPTEDGFSIRGWYIDNGDAKMKFFDMSDNEIHMHVKNKRRPDVNMAFPENVENEVVGFEAEYVGAVPKKVRVHFEVDGKEQDYIVTFASSPFEKYIKTFKDICLKVAGYYRRYGVKATFSRVVEKIALNNKMTYTMWLRKHRPTKGELQEQREHVFEFQPKISIVVPLYKTPHKYLSEFIESVKAQTYANWELCLSDGSGKNSLITTVLRKYEKDDVRIKVVYNEQALQISDNTNAALEIVTGEFIAFADHDDLLAPNALFECVRALNEDKTIEIIYTDEDKVDMNGKEHFMPHFKTDFNIDMLRSVNYICHLFVIRREIYEKVGMLNHEFDGAQDYDFVLRCVETTSHIRHIPKILYHWRAHKNSTAENPESKEYAFQAGKRALEAHYARMGIEAEVLETKYKGSYRTKYILREQPLISIIIPNKDHTDDLDKCISSIERINTYPNYEIIVVENNSTEEETFAYYKLLEQRNRKTKVLFWKGQGFNYPDINNYGAQNANGDYLLFLNNDTEIVNEDCLEEMLGYCMREDVGAVGARLYYEDGTIQHAGVIIGIGGIAGHAFVAFPHKHPGYFGRIQMAQDYSAVTAACIMVKKEVFKEVEGFDKRYAVAFNDVDLCMKIRQAGYLIVYNPYAELNHYESKSRGYEDTPEKVKRFNSEIELFRSRWGDELAKGDPYYSPNLSLETSDFRLNSK